MEATFSLTKEKKLAYIKDRLLPPLFVYILVEKTKRKVHYVETNIEQPSCIMKHIFEKTSLKDNETILFLLEVILWKHTA